MLTIEKVNRLFGMYIKGLNQTLSDKGVDLCFDLTEDLHELENAFYEALGDADEDITLEQAMKVITYNKSELDADEVLPLLDDGDICDYMEEKDCLVIEIKGMVDRQKIKDFVNENIYPYCLNHREALM